ncbi:MAG: CtsR family transcriptional regulator [Clostridia bacterium]|nr:CtsR family transcriptional regulator [Clostridia bacterium]
MNLSDVIESYIKQMMVETQNEVLEIKRSMLAERFKCVPSQINYVIATRFIPELGFYVESRRGGGGCLRICKVNLEEQEYITNILDKMGSKLSQSVADVYLQNLLGYNIIDSRTVKLIKSAISDKSLENVSILDKDKVRADIFKCMVINCL